MKHCFKGFMNVFFYLKIQTTLLVMCCYSEVIEQETLECLVTSPRLFIQIFWVQIFCAECERCRDGLETRLDLGFLSFETGIVLNKLFWVFLWFLFKAEFCYFWFKKNPWQFPNISSEREAYILFSHVFIRNLSLVS